MAVLKVWLFVSVYLAIDQLELHSGNKNSFGRPFPKVSGHRYLLDLFVFVYLLIPNLFTNLCALFLSIIKCLFIKIILSYPVLLQKISYWVFQNLETRN
jgi:hypothetical protein